MKPQPRSRPLAAGVGKLRDRTVFITGSRPEEITAEQLERTFRTNIFAQFFIAKAACRTRAAARQS
jgi:NAD(P)-dependent dehydrogenase (short-subunit alcohol dehydrogenase family)